MKSVLIVGATRNLGKALLTYYVSEPNTIIFATSRYGKPLHHASNVHWISNVDLSHEDAGSIFSAQYGHGFPMDFVYLVAASSTQMFTPETLDSLKFEKELTMYKTSAIGPLFFIQRLLLANILSRGTKIIFVGNEAGSISLCTKGGNYGFHGSQASLNMMAKLLSFDLEPKGIIVGVIYPGPTIANEDESRGDKGDEFQTEQRAKALAKFVETDLNMEKTGDVWAAQGFGFVAKLYSLSRSLIQ